METARTTDPAGRGVSPDGPVYSAQDVRQGEIILKRSWQRIVFTPGLGGAVVLAIVLQFAAG